MRNDALGFFWEDRPIVKVTKEVVKRTPPERTWDRPDYLPGLAEALAFNVPELTKADLLCSNAEEELMFDVEVYPNYFLASFESRNTGKVMCFEMSPWKNLDIDLFTWVLYNFCIVSFNGIKYDTVICALALDGRPPAVLKWASDKIIKERMQPYEVLNIFKVKPLKLPNHIDLIEVAPLRATLKIYSGRHHCKRMQDLPFREDTVLSYEQAAITKYYNITDLRNTLIIRNALEPQLDLRYDMSNQYQIDLRSKSDAQIAEAVIIQELTQMQGRRPTAPIIDPGTAYRYIVPSFLKFQTPLMQWTLNEVAESKFIVGNNGKIISPPSINKLKLQLGYSRYTMGIGGLHSSEKNTCHISNEEYILKDIDAVSFYPKVILNLQLFPPHLGINFLHVYATLVERRISAKRKGQECQASGDSIGETRWKNIAESLKIVINGLFGKLGNMFSVMYAPGLLTQVTLTGQLALLMLVERLELIGIQVVSGNTDGVVIKVPRARIAEYEAVIRQWENDIDFKSDEVEYLALFSRDVNNYIAVKSPDVNGKIKLKQKGAYANPWNDQTKIAERFHKNPTNQICITAIEALLISGVPLVETIWNCKDITQFISIRTVEGGAVKNGEFLGKSVRWYYSVEERDAPIVYATTGNHVPRSNGARPCMDLPSAFPSDIDYDWYLQEATNQLKDIAYLQ